VIPVIKKLAPRGFNTRILEKGRAWLRTNGLPRRGPLPSGMTLSPIWTECLGDLYSAYGGVCAYLAIYIERVVGAPTVDHFVPKSKDVALAYRWSNFRLACLTMNRRKHDHQDVLDPFTLPDDTFRLSLLDGAISVNEVLKAHHPGLYQRASATIARLRLDDEECRTLRREYFSTYVVDPTPRRLRDLERRAPFVWREMVRQGFV
jgi:hypothetical protein